jgi:hypothetical protein
LSNRIEDIEEDLYEDIDGTAYVCNPSDWSTVGYSLAEADDQPESEEGEGNLYDDLSEPPGLAYFSVSQSSQREASGISQEYMNSLFTNQYMNSSSHPAPVPLIAPPPLHGTFGKSRSRPDDVCYANLIDSLLLTPSSETPSPLPQLPLPLQPQLVNPSACARDRPPQPPPMPARLTNLLVKGNSSQGVLSPAPSMDSDFGKR